MFVFSMLFSYDFWHIAYIFRILAFSWFCRIFDFENLLIFCQDMSIFENDSKTQYLAEPSQIIYIIGLTIMKKPSERHENKKNFPCGTTLLYLYCCAYIYLTLSQRQQKSEILYMDVCCALSSTRPVFLFFLLFSLACLHCAYLTWASTWYMNPKRVGI